MLLMKVTIACRAHRRHPLLAALGLALIAVLMISCATPNPNFGRVLLSISVTPATADAQTFPNGEVLYSAKGTFNQEPFTVLVPSTPPYSVQFNVGTTITNQVIATVVTQKLGTAAVQCVTGMSGTVSVGATALANNGTSTTVTGLAQITCP
jgi:hypothetical protein